MGFLKREKTSEEYNDECYEKALATIDEKIKKGIRPHSKNIGYPLSDKRMVKMYLWFDCGKAMELKSEPFYSEEEAKHFSDAFNDNFLYDSTVEKEENQYFVYSGWVLKSGLLSYSIMSNGAYYEFLNASEF